MTNKHQQAAENAISTDYVARDFVTAALTVSVLANITVFVAWMAVTLA